MIIGKRMEEGTCIPGVPAKPRTVSKATSCPGSRVLPSFRTRVRLGALESQLISDNFITLFAAAIDVVDAC